MLVAIFNASNHFGNRRSAQMSGQSALACEQFIQLLRCIFARFDQIFPTVSRQRARALGSNRTLARKTIIYIDNATEVVCTDRNTSAQMSDDQIHLFVFLADLGSIAASDSFLVQSVPNRTALNARQTRNSSHGLQFIGHARISDKCLNVKLLRNAQCQQSA